MKEITLCLLTSGLQPLLGAGEAEAVLGRPLSQLSRRLYLVSVPSHCAGNLLRALYDCVMVQEVVAAKAWSREPSAEAGFYRELAQQCSWGELEGRTFAVAVRKLEGFPPAPSTELAASVADGVSAALGGRCKVDLERPQVIVSLVVSRGAAVVGLRLLRARGDRYRLRSKRYKPYGHPASLTPEDAGVLVNLAGRRSPLLDPFCGSGTVLIEACVRGLEAVGLDIDRRAARGAYANLKHFSCDAWAHVVVGDARALPFRPGAFPAVATNPPYGRVLKGTGEPGGLLSAFLRECSTVVASGAKVALVRPAHLDLEGPWRAAREYSVRVHGGLTRVFAVIEVGR